jgi:hypothetical protein
MMRRSCLARRGVVDRRERADLRRLEIGYARRFAMIDAVNPQGVWSPFGAFSMAVVQGEGKLFT